MPCGACSPSAGRADLRPRPGAEAAAWFAAGGEERALAAARRWPAPTVPARPKSGVSRELRHSEFLMIQKHQQFVLLCCLLCITAGSGKIKSSLPVVTVYHGRGLMIYKSKVG